MTKLKGTYDVDQVKLEEIAILQASINNPDGITSLPKGAEYELKFQVTPGVSLQLKKIRLNFDCDIVIYKDKKRNEPLGVEGKFLIVFQTHIENLQELSSVTSEKLIDLNEELIGSLSNIVYSTSRGIIYTRCLGTVLGKIILPVLSTSKVLGIENLKSGKK